MKSYNLFLDDFRMPVDAFHYTKDTDFNKLPWTIVRNYKEFVRYITDMHSVGHWPAIISYDHDLAEGHYHKNMQEGKLNYESSDFSDDDNKTGHHCAHWLVDFCMKHVLPLPHFKVHSMNPVGRDNIIGLLENFSNNWTVAPKAINFNNKTYKP